MEMRLYFFFLENHYITIISVTGHRLFTQSSMNDFQEDQFHAAFIDDRLSLQGRLYD